MATSPAAAAPPRRLNQIARVGLLTELAGGFTIAAGAAAAAAASRSPRSPELHRRPEPEFCQHQLQAARAPPDRAGQSAGAASRARGFGANKVNGATIALIFQCRPFGKDPVADRARHQRRRRADPAKPTSASATSAVAPRSGFCQHKFAKEKWRRHRQPQRRPGGSTRLRGSAC